MKKHQIDPVMELRKRLQTRTQKDVADELKLSPSFLCDVLLGRRALGEKGLKALGLRAVTTYERI